jgi:hypothetical protein
MMDAFRKSDEAYRVSVMVEVIAASSREALDYADSRLIGDSVVNDPRFVSFSVTTPGEPTRDVMP